MRKSPRMTQTLVGAMIDGALNRLQIMDENTEQWHEMFLLEQDMDVNSGKEEKKITSTGRLSIYVGIDQFLKCKTINLLDEPL